MNESLPPASIEAEQALLGGILFNPELITKFKTTLPIEAFFVGAHQTIYQSMIFVHNLGYLPDLIQLTTYLEGQKVLNSIGGTTALSRLLNQTVSASNCDRYAKLIMEKWQRRKLIALGYEIAELATDNTQSLNEIYNAVKDLLPEEIMEAKHLDNEPIITKATYTVFSRSGQKKLELEADVKDHWNLADSIAKVAARAKMITESIWGENIN